MNSSLIILSVIFRWGRCSVKILFDFLGYTVLHCAAIINVRILMTAAVNLQLNCTNFLNISNTKIDKIVQN